MKPQNTNKKTKILVAMSGGVDSSVAAFLMKEKGYEVIGAFMKNWSDTKNEFGECSWKDDRRSAMDVAAKLKIPLITLDFEKEYRHEVIDEMFKLYKKGVTPNPDIDCNQKVKFPLLWKSAKKLGCEFVITGHFARTKKTGKGFEMLRAKDENKDQSYFLYRISEKDLERTLFPIGNYTKSQVREIAKKNGLLNWNRKSTVGICFVGKINLKEFLQIKIKPKKGKILDPEGNTIGQHDGIYYYTIGQRLGPRYGIHLEKNSKDKKHVKRWYVARKDVTKNEIVAAPEGHPLLYRKEIVMRDVHWIDKDTKDKMNQLKVNNKVVKYNKKPATNSQAHNISLVNSKKLSAIKNKQQISVRARIRQVGELLPSTVKYNPTKKRYEVFLKEAITGVSEGQAIVLYRGRKVLGGGVIGFE